MEIFQIDQPVLLATTRGLRLETHKHSARQNLMSQPGVVKYLYTCSRGVQRAHVFWQWGGETYAINVPISTLTPIA